MDGTWRGGWPMNHPQRWMAPPIGLGGWLPLGEGGGLRATPKGGRHHNWDGRVATPKCQV